MSLAKFKDFLFEDYDSGEQFFVETWSLKEAWKIIFENFGEEANIDFIDEYSVEEAEILGYDTF